MTFYESEKLNFSSKTEFVCTVEIGLRVEFFKVVPSNMDM